ncbi:MAG: VPLPA-CTERM sorting domain-containing protein [Pseudomonadota bacterium]
MKRFSILGAALALTLLGAPAPAAILVEVTLTQDGVGDNGPDWFGRLAFDPVTLEYRSGSILVDDVLYDSPSWFQLRFLPDREGMFGTLSPVPIERFSNVSTEVLQFGTSITGMRVIRQWNFAPCSGFGCGGGVLAGSYELNIVPLPASGVMMIGGLLGAAVWARRRGSASAT